MRKTKIIALMNAYTQGMSGGDHRFIEIARRLVNKDDVKIEIVTSGLGGKLCESHGLKGNNITYIVTTNEQRVYNVILLYLKRIFAALKIKPSNREDDLVLYSTSDFIPDTLPAFFLKSIFSKTGNRKVRWVQVIHHLYESPAKRKGKNILTNLLGFLSQRISFIMIKKAGDLIITVNPIVKQQLLRLGFNMPIMVNYNGVDLARIGNINPSNKKYDCVFLGRLNISKGIFDLVKIWKIIIDKNPKVTLAIIGGGDNRLKQELKRDIDRNGLNKNIDVLGYLNEEDVFGILKSSKVFVFPSHEEGFGIAILEAMACGLPVVAWDLPAYKEIFTKGIVKIPENNYEEFANMIIKLLEEEELRKQLTEEAKKQATEYDWNIIANNEIKLIKKLMEG